MEKYTRAVRDSLLTDEEQYAWYVKEQERLTEWVYSAWRRQKTENSSAQMISGSHRLRLTLRPLFLPLKPAPQLFLPILRLPTRLRSPAAPKHVLPQPVRTRRRPSEPRQLGSAP